jgi:hypothetical protein
VAGGPWAPAADRAEDSPRSILATARPWPILFAALEVGPGAVTTITRERHTGADFLGFLRRVERAYPGVELHVVLEDVSTHKTPAVRAWLERHPRITLPFSPTSASG